MGIRLHQLTSLLLKIGLCLFLPTVLRAQTAEPSKVNSSVLAQAQEEFSQRRFTEALQTYRLWLRDHPNDQDAWTRFAATYYHTGQAQQALEYLRKAKPSRKLRAFNTYYQALCFDALGDRPRAKRYLAKVSKMDEPLAEDALFEWASMEFEDADAGAARAAAHEYLKRFKEGRFVPQMETILNRLALAGKIPIEGTQHARYSSSFYETHPLSIVSVPHSWHYLLRYYYETGTRSNPNFEGNRSTVTAGIPYQNFMLKAIAGMGLGPFKGKHSESFVGYVYEQKWMSDADRLKVWTDDPGDIEYFPFRPDLLERRHRFYFESIGQFGDFFIGAYAHLQFYRAGSEYFPAPERPEIRKAFDVGTQSYFVPSVEWNYHPQHSAKAFLMFKKFLNREQNDFSYKSYNLFGSSLAPFLSATLEHNSSFPQLLGLKLTLEAFQHQFIYNDFWESYTGRGFAGVISINPWPFLSLAARASFETDNYTYDTIQSQGCNSVPGSPTAACPRVGKTQNIGFSASYIMAKQRALSIMVHTVDHKDDIFKVNNESEFDVLVQFTQAFPTLNDVSRFVEPYLGIAESRGVY